MNISKQFLTPNPYSRPQIPLKKITGVAWHYVGNPGTSAQNNRNYFENLKTTHATYVSSHYVIGLNGEIIQCIPENEVAYCTMDANYYSISIECCHPDSTGKFTAATEQALVELTADICKRYGLDPAKAIMRHYDVTGKKCPLYYVNHPEAYEAAKKRVSDLVNGKPSGWIQQEGKWWYRHADGSYTKNGWEKISGEWYYFDEKGWMKTGWIQYKGGWYCCAENGKMYHDTWKLLGGKWYVFDANGKACEGWYHSSDKRWYYLKPGTCEMLKGWLELDGRWYYLSPKASENLKEGEMVKGKQTIDGKVYRFAEKTEGNVKEGQMIA